MEIRVSTKVAHVPTGQTAMRQQNLQNVMGHPVPTGSISPCNDCIGKEMPDIKVDRQKGKKRP